LDLPELVAQLQIREQLVVTLERQVQVQQELVLAVAPLELVEHPCLPKMFGVQKMLRLQENLAYLF
jgi:hypothetical protein